MRGYGRLLQYSHRPPPQPHPSSSCLSRGSILPRHRQRQSYWWKDEGTPFGVRGGRSQKNKASRSLPFASSLFSFGMVSRLADRKSVVSGKSVSVLIDLVVTRIINKKTIINRVPPY